MSEILLDPQPFYDPPLQGGTDLFSKAWYRYFEQRDEYINSAQYRIKSVQATGQTAAIATTDLGITNGGIYQISWVLRITTPATTSSSVQIGITYTDLGVTVSQAGAAVTGNATNTVQSGVAVIETDANSPVTFATTYSSVGATSMAYKISVLSVRLQ